MRKLICLSLIFITATAFAQKPYEYNLSVGDKFEVSAEMSQDIEQDAMGQKMQTEQSSTQTDLFEVVAFENGIYRIKTTAIGRKFEVNNAMMSMEMNSDGESDNDLPFKIMVNKSYEFTMNKQGEVMEVFGLEKIRKAMTEELSGTMFASQASDLLAVYQEETVKSMMDSQFNIYPKGKQDAWQKTVSMVVNNMPVETKINYSYTNTDEITAVGDVSLKGDVSQMGMTFNTDLSGKQNSVFKIDAKTGLPMSASITQDISGKMSAQGMDIPMELMTKSTLTTTIK